MQLIKRNNLLLLALPVTLSLSGCLGAPPNTGLLSLPVRVCITVRHNLVIMVMGQFWLH